MLRPLILQVAGPLAERPGSPRHLPLT